MKTMLRMIVGAAAVLLMPVAAHAADDPFLGVWHLNKAKSIIGKDPGVKSKEIVIALTPDGGMITETVETTTGNGEKQIAHLPFAYGKFVPQPGPGMDAFSVYKTDEHTMFWVAQLKGQTVAKLEVDLSPDGRQMTFRYLSKASDPDPALARDRYVYEKQ
ncbi:hypothetical protein QH494_09155 [Sphingomonas sp. AR_OL41]|uniref:hypothetical protein n=1 Tax=Sphingomonas sp. AR_OL41 TaxID=3042729 RepID=UPI0024809F25|nr:hypothetical protein [Sphingomonas sp. AR_OL41]MDH7972348.1 hypothetical protein [Sphingomonas sp. AR_OL41]